MPRIEELDEAWDDEKNNSHLNILHETENWISIDVNRGTFATHNNGDEFHCVKINMRTLRIIVDKELEGNDWDE